MPLYQVEITKVLVATIFIDAEGEEEAAQVALQELPDDEQFNLEDVNVADVQEVDADKAHLEVFLHNDDRGRTVKEWLDDVEGDYE